MLNVHEISVRKALYVFNEALKTVEVVYISETSFHFHSYMRKCSAGVLWITTFIKPAASGLRKIGETKPCSINCILQLWLVKDKIRSAWADVEAFRMNSEDVVLAERELFLIYETQISCMEASKIVLYRLLNSFRHLVDGKSASPFVYRMVFDFKRWDVRRRLWGQLTRQTTKEEKPILLKNHCLSAFWTWFAPSW